MPEQPTVTFEVHYIKSNFFRVIRADGVYGGSNGRGFLNMSFYSERVALPRKASITATVGDVVRETITETKSGIVREIESDVVMNLDAAVAFYAWLGQKIEEIRKATQVSDSSWEEMLKKYNAKPP